MTAGSFMTRINCLYVSMITTYMLQYWIICSKKLKVGDIFILYCIVLIYKFDLKNSIGQLIHIRMLSYDNQKREINNKKIYCF
jgi:hypothetical protein